MKLFKKIMAVAITLAMALALCVPAFADEGDSTGTGSSTDTATTYTIKAPPTTHQYEIYQIFTGTLSAANEKTILTDEKWGANGTGTTGDTVPEAVLNELKAISSDASDAVKLATITKYANLNTTPVGTVSNGSTYSAVAGYYLIKDKDNTVSGNDAYTTYIVTVAGDVTIEAKSEVPSFEKKIKDTNDSLANSTSDWQDSADYDIGDQVPFKLEGTVASNYDNYTTYYFAFHDVEEKGLTFNKDSVKVYVGDKEITTGYEVVTNPTDGCTFEVVFNDLKDIKDVKAGSKISVEYTSLLNDDAVLGNEGNVNKAKLEFSNNPSNTQVGKPEKPGETPWDNVIVFTYQVVVNKVDENNDPLKGAEFTLEKVLADGSKKTITVVKSTDGTSFTFKGLDDGDYILTESKTPDGYNHMDPIKFTVKANHTIEWNGENRTGVLTSLTGSNDDTTGTPSGQITFTADADKSDLTTNIVNKKGVTLPSTGGIGTTIFYVIGGLLMAAAAVLFVTKKRVESDK